MMEKKMTQSKLQIMFQEKRKHERNKIKVQQKNHEVTMTQHGL